MDSTPPPKPIRTLSKADVAILKTRLAKWRTPTAMDAILDSYRETHLFHLAGQGGAQSWREMHCAVEAARIVGAEVVRLVIEDRPDFEMRLSGETVPCELVEVIKPGRRLGQEMTELADLHNAGELLPPEHFDPDEELIALGPALRIALEKKCAKGYPPKTVLVVRLQLSLFPSQDVAAQKIVQEAVSSAVKQFRAVIVIYGEGRLVCYNRIGAEPLPMPATPSWRARI